MAKSKTAKQEKKAADAISRQERFCLLVAREFKTPVEAYVEAFEWKGDYLSAVKTAENLCRVPEIEKRIEELAPFEVETPRDNDMLTLGEHLRELAQLERIAVRMGQLGAAVSAAVHRGKASGLYIERAIVGHVTLEDLIAGSRKDGTVALQGGRVVGHIEGQDGDPTDESGAPTAGRPMRTGSDDR